ncbi:TonB C-terminal domain-containing protein [Massilia sp. Leaf139]|uniref:TonB C-terminal domain-containing protein n=1 Tax=Massilia sp. Leaf139 TaxID=1736272 RepID=UPI0009E6CB6E|nr:TonB C-terminal domain-containing protein [Massilia sp. Leaf139]
MPQYDSPPDTRPGDYTVAFEVFLDADGKVIGMNTLDNALLPGYKDAVAAALRRARPFPPETARIFEFRLTLRIQTQRQQQRQTTQV